MSDRAAPLRVVIAEDTVLLREGLSRVLSEAGLEVAGTAADAEQLLHLVDVLRPDVVLSDVRMPPTQTTEGLRVSAGNGLERPSSSCRTTWRPTPSSISWLMTREALDTCSRNASPTSRSSSMQSAESLERVGDRP